jgi:hypothetical protein
MAIEVLPSLELPVLFDDHHETFSTRTSSEATAMTRITFAIAAVLSLAFTPLAAQDFQKGWDAYNAGDFATAIQEWTPLAVAGDASAQYNLGVTYRSGESTGYSDILGGLTSWVN